MGQITDEMLVQELRRTDAKMVRLCKAVEETLVVAKAAVRDLEEGRRRINAIKNQHGFGRSGAND